MELISKSFSDNSKIPVRFTGEGQDISPPLEWCNVPEDTVSFALMCEDTDALDENNLPLVHWIIFNIPASVHNLPLGIFPQSLIELPIRPQQGLNSFANLGYTGPMPPFGGGIHHYVFKLFALDKMLDLTFGAIRDEVLTEMQGHVLAEALLVTTYERILAAKIG